MFFAIYNRIHITFLFLFWSAFCYATNPIGTISYLVDSTNALQVHQVIQFKSKDFKKSENRSPNIGFSSATLWVRVDLPNNQEELVLSLSNLHLDSVNAYVIKEEGTVRQYLTGDARAFSSRDIPTNSFSFLIHPGESKVLLKLNSCGTVATPINIHTIRGYFYFEEISHAILWLFYGVIFASFVANFAFYIALKDKLYLYYIFYVAANAIYTGTDFAIGFQFLWPNSPYINKFSLVFYCTSIFIFIFGDYFLELRSRNLLLHRLFHTIIALNIVCAIVSIIDYSTGARMIVLLILASPLLLFGSSLYIFLKTRSKIYFIFLISWSFYLGGIAIYSLAAAGVVTYSPHISLAILLCSTFEMVMLFVIVVFKINQIKEENIQNNKQIIELLSEKELILKDQNVQLEQKVKQRTLEMLEKNDEISSQNEEIVSQNEELLLQQQELMKQRQGLEIQSMELDEVNKAYSEVNRRLNDYKLQLEDLVKARTDELRKANFELEGKNNQLEQYAFMAAHNLRSPIAALLGLTKFIESDDDITSIKEITKRIHVSVKKLDAVVRSMSTILNSRNTDEKPHEAILLGNVLVEALSMLETEVIDSQAIITHDFTKCPYVKAIPTYLHNLFFNLISNSIKYKKDGERLQVNIHSELVDNQCLITFSDNGLGIDLPKYANELFKPFKRFHAKGEGSGIGLYLVKTQIEAMGGTIEVQSQQGIGATFLVRLDN